MPVQIVPIENIQGRKAVEGGDMCLRKTTNGVDLNRNWGYAWVQVSTIACSIALSLILSATCDHQPNPLHVIRHASTSQGLFCIQAESLVRQPTAHAVSILTVASALRVVL